MKIRVLPLQNYLYISGTDDMYSITADHEFSVATFATGHSALSKIYFESDPSMFEAGFIEYRVWDDKTRVDRVVPVPTELYGTPGPHIDDHQVHSVTTAVRAFTEGDNIQAGAAWKILMFDESRP